MDQKTTTKMNVENAAVSGLLHERKKLNVNDVLNWSHILRVKGNVWTEETPPTLPCPVTEYPPRRAVQCRASGSA